MGLFKRRELSPIDAQAAKAFKRGDTIHVRTFHAVPGRPEQHLAVAIQRVEAAGWKMEQQQETGEGLSRAWTCTFRAVPLT